MFITLIVLFDVHAGTIKSVVEWLGKSIENPKRRYKGFTPQELVQGLDKLAVNDSNKIKVGRTDVSTGVVTRVTIPTAALHMYRAITVISIKRRQQCLMTQ